MDLHVCCVLFVDNVANNASDFQVLGRRELLKHILELTFLNEISELEVIFGARFKAAARVLCVHLQILSPARHSGHLRVVAPAVHLSCYCHSHRDIQRCAGKHRGRVLVHFRVQECELNKVLREEKDH